MSETEKSKTVEVIDAYLKAVRERDTIYISATFTSKSKK